MAARLPDLYSIKASPWSRKPNWALEHHQCQVNKVAYKPPLGEVSLRWRLGKWSGRVSVPVLFDEAEGAVLTESFEIAEWADSHSTRPEAERLFPVGRRGELLRWNGLSDDVLNYGRKQLATSEQGQQAAQKVLLPGFLTNLGRVSTMLTKFVFSQIASKYKDEFAAATEDKARAALITLRDTLKASGGMYVLKQFTYADIVMATAINYVQAPPNDISRMPDSVRAMFGMPRMAEEFPDLLTWRDTLMRAHYPRLQPWAGTH